MPRQPLRVVSTKIPMEVYSKLANDADRRGITVSLRVNEILTAHFKQRSTPKPKKATKTT